MQTQPTRLPTISEDVNQAFSRLLLEVAHYNATRRGKIFLNRAAVQYADALKGSAA